ncbi:hypothetical protein Tco_1282421 [Tanacetum coccineum]
MGLWYPRVSSFDLEAYLDSDYDGANLDMKSTTGGCQFLGRRLISWQCKKQTIVATSTTEVEYVAAANYCGHHFIRDAYEKKLIQVLKIHTDDNVADLLTKAFNVSSVQYAKAFLTINDEFQEVNWALKSHWEEIKTSFMRLLTFLREAPFNASLYITAKVAGKPVSIFEASIRSDLLFDDADGIDSLPNQAIFDAIQLMEDSSGIMEGRKSAKAEPSVHKDPLFDELDDNEIDNIETEDAQGMGRTRYMVHEEKERKEKEVSTKDALGTDKQKDSTDRPDEGTDRSRVSTDKENVSTDRPDEGTDDQTKGRYDPQTPPTTTTPTIFGDDETIAQVLLNISQAKAVLREKEKGVKLKDVEETERPRPTSTRSLLTLKPLPKIDPKDKEKKKI